MTGLSSVTGDLLPEIPLISCLLNFLFFKCQYFNCSVDSFCLFYCLILKKPRCQLGNSDALINSLSID